MMDSMSEFPRLAQTPGRSAAEWLIDGRWVAGELELL